MLASTFIICSLATLIIGLFAARQAQNNTNYDYYMANYNTRPFVASISFLASNYSSYMFLGLVGLSYKSGLWSLSFMFCKLLGDYFSGKLLFERINSVSHKEKVITYPGLLAKLANPEKNFRVLRMIASLVIVLVLPIYASVQFLACGLAINYIFGINVVYGILIGATVIIAYTAYGGLRASLYTDILQWVLMIIAVLSIIISITSMYSIPYIFEQANKIPHYLSVVPYETNFIGMILLCFALFISGFTSLAQPHIMSRISTMQMKPGNVTKMRIYYYTSSILLTSTMVFVGICLRIIMPDYENPEYSALYYATSSLHPLIAGMFLSGLFAAAVSTVDSMLLSISSTMKCDLMNDNKIGVKSNVYLLSCIALCIACIAIVVHKVQFSSIFWLVMGPRFIMACAFIPIIIGIGFYGTKLSSTFSEKQFLIVLLAGCLSAAIWQCVPYSGHYNSGFIGVLIGIIAFSIICYINKMHAVVKNK